MNKSKRKSRVLDYKSVRSEDQTVYEYWLYEPRKYGQNYYEKFIFRGGEFLNDPFKYVICTQLGLMRGILNGY